MRNIIAVIGVVVLLASGLYYTFGRGEPTLAQQQDLQATAAQTPANSVISEGVVVPAASTELNWVTTGTVAHLLVQEGDRVAQGAPLAQLDTRDLELQVAQAQVQLQSVQARRAQAVEGNATPEQIAAAEAGVASAQAQLARARSGNVSPADISAAEAGVARAQAQLEQATKGNATTADLAYAQAGVRAAEARLNDLRNPTAEKISAAQLAVRQAEINLQQARDDASAVKTNAQLSMDQAVEALTQAQSAYVTAQQQWQHVQDSGTDPSNPTTVSTTGVSTPNKLNDNQQQVYYDAFVQAEAAMRSAEQAVAQAKVTYDNARQQEITAVQQAEAQLSDAQVQLEALLNPSPAAIAQQQAALDQARANLQKLRQGGTAADIAAAQATLQQMQAHLEKLQEGGTEADIAAAQAELDRAQANLEQLTAPATKTDLAILEASVAQAEQELKQAELALEKATLRAPIAGTVAAINLKVGEVPSAAQAAIVLADFEHWQIETDDLTELSVVRINTGDPVTIRFDALQDVILPGTVERISSIGTNKHGDITYTVVVKPAGWDARLRWNMTATVTIDTGEGGVS